MSREEQEVARVEAWEEIWGSLGVPAGQLYEQASDLHNMVNIAKMAGPQAGLRETASLLRSISETTKLAQQYVVAEASRFKIPDTDLAHLLNVHRNTVRRWRTEYEEWLEEQSVDE